jgi:hypothetical protein
LWLRSVNDVSTTEYKDFYKAISKVLAASLQPLCRGGHNMSLMTGHAYALLSPHKHAGLR